MFDDVDQQSLIFVLGIAIISKLAYDRRVLRERIFSWVLYILVNMYGDSQLLLIAEKLLLFSCRRNLFAFITCHMLATGRANQQVVCAARGIRARLGTVNVDYVKLASEFLYVENWSLPRHLPAEELCEATRHLVLRGNIGRRVERNNCQLTLHSLTQQYGPE